MVEITVSEVDGSAEFVLDEGCGQCGGDVAVKVSAWGTRGFCRDCHSLIRAVVRWQDGAMAYGQVALAEA